MFSQHDIYYNFSMDVMWLKSHNFMGVIPQKGTGHLSIKKLPWELHDKVSGIGFWLD